MDFERFRTLKGWTLDQAATAMRDTDEPGFAKITASMIAKHERGMHFPAPRFVARYAEVTEGAVTWDDWERLRKTENKPRRQTGPRAKAPVHQAA